MPIYEYQCSECNHITEQITSNTELRKITCSVCDAQATRIISHNWFNLIGNCWGRDGYTTGREKTVAGEAFIDYQAKIDGERREPLPGLGETLINRSD